LGSPIFKKPAIYNPHWDIFPMDISKYLWDLNNPILQSYSIPPITPLQGPQFMDDIREIVRKWGMGPRVVNQMMTNFKTINAHGRI
jgi:hypothetical protein